MDPLSGNSYTAVPHSADFQAANGSEADGIRSEPASDQRARAGADETTECDKTGALAAVQRILIRVLVTLACRTAAVQHKIRRGRAHDEAADCADQPV
jgi:hypothetical protein